MHTQNSMDLFLSQKNECFCEYPLSQYFPLVFWKICKRRYFLSHFLEFPQNGAKDQSIQSKRKKQIYYDSNTKTSYHSILPTNQLTSIWLHSVLIQCLTTLLTLKDEIMYMQFVVYWVQMNHKVSEWTFTSLFRTAHDYTVAQWKLTGPGPG